MLKSRGRCREGCNINKEELTIFLGSVYIWDMFVKLYLHYDEQLEK